LASKVYALGTGMYSTIGDFARFGTAVRVRKRGYSLIYLSIGFYSLNKNMDRINELLNY
jgi:hypothetical protein